VISQRKHKRSTKHTESKRGSESEEENEAKNEVENEEVVVVRPTPTRTLVRVGKSPCAAPKNKEEKKPAKKKPKVRVLAAGLGVLLASTRCIHAG
jgi:hypothetical protein